MDLQSVRVSVLERSGKLKEKSLEYQIVLVVLLAVLLVVLMVVLMVK